jgi:mannose-6-phosphate isomerase-like protein (cupin superfamily)
VSERGYEVLSLDDLGRYPQDDALLLPLRLKLGLRAFGANAWTAAVGDHVVPHHTEESGDEELYVVVRGRARFSVGDTTLDAIPGTLVHVEAGTVREAIAEEPDTVVLAVGGTPGKAYEVHGWEDVRVAFGEAADGDVEAGRRRLEQLMESNPRNWEGWYNLACLESRFGDRDRAFEHLEKAVSLAGEAKQYARGDSDFEPLHGDERWAAIAG